MNFKIPTQPHWPSLLPDNKLKSNKYLSPNFSSMQNMDDFDDRDAMLRVIASLIAENQNLKKKNSCLIHKLQIQSYPPPRRDGKWHNKAQDEQVQNVRSRKLKECKYCKTIHVWGKSRCPKYNMGKNSNIDCSSTISKSRSTADSDKGKSITSQMDSLRYSSSLEENTADDQADKAETQARLENSKDQKTKEVAYDHKESAPSKCSSTEDGANKSIRLKRKKKRKCKQNKSESNKAKATDDQENQKVDNNSTCSNLEEITKSSNEGEYEAENELENALYDSCETWIKNVEDIPLELKVHKELLHCKEVIGLTHDKEYQECKMKVKLLEEALVEGKSNLERKDKENSTSVRKKCNGIQK